MRSLILGLMIGAMTVGFGLLEGSDPDAAGGVVLYFVNYLAMAIEHSGALLLITAAVAITMRRDRGVDFSAGAVCVLTAAVMHRAGLNLWMPLVATGAVMGVAIGALNALLIRRVRTAPMLITLGTMILAYCAALAITKHAPAESMHARGTMAMLSRPIVIVPASIALFAGLMLLRRFAPLTANVWALYTLGGLIAGGAAVIHLAALGRAAPNLMIDLELTAVVAALLGGMRLTESRGSLAAAGLAAINLAVLREGCISLQVRLGEAIPLEPRVMYLLTLTGIALLILGIRGFKSRRAG